LPLLYVVLLLLRK